MALLSPTEPPHDAVPLRREQIKLQVALITPLIHVKGYAAPETRAVIERARMLIEQAQVLGEPPEDPLILFSALHGFLTMNVVAFNGDVLRRLAAEFLALAEKQETMPLSPTAPTVPFGALLVAHRVVGICLLFLGDFLAGLPHFERAIELYDPVEHRPLATLFGTDTRARALCYRSWTFWFLGYPKAAVLDAYHAVHGAREMGLAGTLMNTLALTSLTHAFCGDYVTATAQLEELTGLAEKKGSLYWKAFATWLQGCLLAHIGNAPEAVGILTSGIAAWRSTGATLFAPMQLSYLAAAYAKLGQFDDAWRLIGEAMTAIETTKERSCEAEVNRTAGEIALASPKPNVAQAGAHFDRALTVARQQQAKSWELRASISLARLWRSQGKVQQARELLAPVYGWFTEGFDTRDLKEAKALLDALAS